MPSCIKMMNLEEKTQKVLEENHIHLNDMYDQHFLIDEKIIEEMLQIANISKEDTVLEIGPGTGNITAQLVTYAKKVIAVEIDEQFKQALQKLSQNIEFVFEDANTFLNKIKKCTKIVANIPYQLCEPLMHYLCTAQQFQAAILIVPKKFAVSIQRHPIFSAFLSINVIKEVPKESFFPIPKTSSVIISITHKVDDAEELSAFIRRKLYLQRDKKLKNALRETLINLYAFLNKELTKRRARELISNIKISQKVLETKIEQLPLENYAKIAADAEKVFKHQNSTILVK